VILDLSHVNVIDVSGLEVMEEQLRGFKMAGKQLLLCGVSRQPLRMLSRAGFLDEVGRHNVCRSIVEALRTAERVGLQQEELLSVEGPRAIIPMQQPGAVHDVNSGHLLPTAALSINILSGRGITLRGDLQEEDIFRASIEDDSERV
jgi:hypothetical protein